MISSGAKRPEHFVIRKDLHNSLEMNSDEDPASEVSAAR